MSCQPFQDENDESRNRLIKSIGNNLGRLDRAALERIRKVSFACTSSDESSPRAFPTEANVHKLVELDLDESQDVNLQRKLARINPGLRVDIRLMSNPAASET